MLNEAPLCLAGKVLQDGKVIYSRDEPARVTYEVRVRACALDSEIHARELDRQLLATMAKNA